MGIVRKVKEFFKISSNGPKDGSGDACMRPASGEEIAYAPQVTEGYAREFTTTHQSAPIPSVNANIHSVEEHAYPLSAVLPQIPVQSLPYDPAATQQHMAQQQMAHQQQMSLQQQSVRQQMPRPFRNSATQPFMMYQSNGEHSPILPSPFLPSPESFPTQGVPRIGVSAPLSKILGDKSLKSILSLDKYDFVPNVNVTTARVNASTSAMAFSSLGGPLATNQRRRSAFATMTTPHPSLQASVANDLTGAFLELELDNNGDGAVLSPLEFELLSMSKESNILAISPMCPSAMCRTSWKLSDFHKFRELHRGYGSVVWQAKCKLTQELVVLKVYCLEKQCDLQRVQLHREIHLHSKLHHKNVVQFYSCFKEDDCVVVVLEHCSGGNLMKVMRKLGGRLYEREAIKHVMLPMLEVLGYLHSMGIVHRDIKPENVLFMADSTLKLADFGLAIDVTEERANTRAGTLDYMAPEVLRCPQKSSPDEGKSVNTPNNLEYTGEVDFWAMGVFAYEILTGVAPYHSAKTIDVAHNIMFSKIKFPIFMSEHSRDFVTQAQHKDPSKRMTTQEMMDHPWIDSFKAEGSA